MWCKVLTDLLTQVERHNCNHVQFVQEDCLQCHTFRLLYWYSALCEGISVKMVTPTLFPLFWFGHTEYNDRLTHWLIHSCDSHLLHDSSSEMDLKQQQFRKMWLWCPVMPIETNVLFQISTVLSITSVLSWVDRSQWLLMNTAFTKPNDPWSEAVSFSSDATNGNLIYTSRSYVMLLCLITRQSWIGNSAESNAGFVSLLYERTNRIVLLCSTTYNGQRDFCSKKNFIYFFTTAGGS